MGESTNIRVITYWVDVPEHFVEAKVSRAAIVLEKGSKSNAEKLLDEVIDDTNETILAQAEDALRVQWNAYHILTSTQDLRQARCS